MKILHGVDQRAGTQKVKTENSTSANYANIEQPSSAAAGDKTCPPESTTANPTRTKQWPPQARQVKHVKPHVHSYIPKKTGLINAERKRRI